MPTYRRVVARHNANVGILEADQHFLVGHQGRPEISAVQLLPTKKIRHHRSEQNVKSASAGQEGRKIDGRTDGEDPCSGCESLSSVYMLRMCRATRRASLKIVSDCLGFVQRHKPSSR